MPKHPETIDRPAEDDRAPASSTAEQPECGGTFVLRDARFRGKGGGVPGVDPDDWMSIKHLVRGAGS